MKITDNNIELNDQFRKALLVMEKGNKHIFVTGKAGTGKSTLLTYFRNTTKKKVVILAPTGVAALNVRGQTIHSFFRFKPDITIDKIKRVIGNKKNIYKNIDAIVIDEVSMVRSDLLDCVDRFMRLNGKNSSFPFGDVQMIFIGDLYQLPPIVSGKERKIFTSYYKSQYFFDAKAFENLSIEFIELEKIYRQKDQYFISLLNSIRNNSANETQLEAINSRLNRDFEPKSSDFYMYLTTTNDLAEEVNQKKLARLKGKLFTYQGLIAGDFDTKSLPTKIELFIKVGSQIMMLNNDREARWVNGSIGKIIEIKKDKEKKDTVIVELADGQVIEVTPYTWELFRFSYDEKFGRIMSKTVGSFTQYPFMLAWAVTIHKSQGKTFDNVIIDIGRGTFAHGQMYVALSRCTTLSGIVLKKPIQKKHIFMDWKVVKFVTRYQYQISEKKLSLENKIKIITDAIIGNKELEILYLKSNDEKSKRFIKPSFVGEMEYLDRKFIGVSGFDSKNQEERTFRVEKILEMSVV